MGATHGFLVTRMRLQPFVVTLCGLLLYRGIARGITRDQTQGFGIVYQVYDHERRQRVALEDRRREPLGGRVRAVPEGVGHGVVPGDQREVPGDDEAIGADAASFSKSGAPSA